MKTPRISMGLAIALLGWQNAPANVNGTSIEEAIYGTTPEGREIKIFTLVNGNGLRARVTEFGAILVSMETPDRNGKLADLTLGYDALPGWIKDSAYFGATVGRFGNRIANGRFTLDGKEHTLATNSNANGIPCHLHGGVKGFNKRIWTGRKTAEGVEFTYLSPEGEEGYPGNLSVKILYSLNSTNELRWEATATTDAPTVINLVQHTYWNISGDPAAAITDHTLTVLADSFLPTTRGMIPTGKLEPVAGTPLDFTSPREVGARIDADFEPLKLAGGYDHCWVIRDAGKGLRPAARLADPKSGRVMELSTDQPGIHIYTANAHRSTGGKGGATYGKRSAICLETENFPDAPNQPDFPSAALRPGQTYRHTLAMRFSAE